MSLVAWLKLMRAEHAAMVIVAIAVGAQLTAPHALAIALAAAVGPALITLASFAFNDYIDYASDRALKRLDRPLVTGAIKKTNALRFAATLFSLGIAASAISGLVAFSITAFYAALSIAYSAILKKSPLIGNICVASTYAIPFLYGAALFGKIPQLVAIISAIAFSAGLGRELFQTLRDVKGDAAIGAITLPMLIGASATARLSASLIAAAVSLSIFILLQSRLASALLLLVSDALLIVSAALILRSQRVETLEACRNYTLAAFALATLSFLALSLGY